MKSYYPLRMSKQECFFFGLAYLGFINPIKSCNLYETLSERKNKSVFTDRTTNTEGLMVGYYVSYSL